MTNSDLDAIRARQERDAADRASAYSLWDQATNEIYNLRESTRLWSESVLKEYERLNGKKDDAD